MSTLIAQVSAPPAEGLSASMFQPLFVGAVIYVVLYLVGATFQSRDDPRGETVGDVAFVVLALMGIYTVVLAITALASEFDLIVDMLKIVAIIVAFFGILIVLLFGIGTLFGLIGRVTSRKKRVTT